MKDILAERLRAARERAGYSSAEEAAETFEWKASGYRHHENGTRGFGIPEALKYARAFRSNPLWLLGLEKYGGGEAEAAPQEPPQPFLPSTEQLSRLLAFAMHVAPDDHDRLEEIEVVAGGVGIGIRKLAKRPDLADDPGYWTATLDAIDEAIAAAKSGPSRRA